MIYIAFGLSLLTIVILLIVLLHMKLVHVEEISNLEEYHLASMKVMAQFLPEQQRTELTQAITKEYENSSNQPRK